MKYRWIAMGLLACGAAAQADVQVSFVKPETFVDIKDNNGFRDEDVLKDIEKHLLAQAQKYLPGRDVRFDVTDVDLAGHVEPFPRVSNWVRVMRTVTLPSISLSYEVREEGKVVRQGKALLRDMNYQDGFNGYFSSDRLRHEKRMMDRWFEAEFGAAKSVAAAR
ncbi:DUF3016 domain-containing protein [Roseateles sp. LKC17W]|uniref:DUF3016 domain-containing protein n=1 Tax=Pelomonas margarita TaxID=3299031 RepID=A0ABW7FD49_9BURK